MTNTLLPTHESLLKPRFVKTYHDEFGCSITVREKFQRTEIGLCVSCGVAAWSATRGRCPILNRMLAAASELHVVAPVTGCRFFVERKEG